MHQRRRIGGLSAGVAAAMAVATWSVGAQSPAARPATDGRVATVTGFDTPESARYDPSADLYYVSNVTGHPTAADNTGFISKIGPDGQVVNRKWIAGGVDGVTLNGPKGLALVGDDLWVADITVVRKFDRRTGQQTGVVNLAPLGAAFLNDVGPGPDGSLFVSDTGLVFDNAGGAALTAPQRIFRIDRAGVPSIVVEDRELEGPNGVFYDEPNRRLLVASLRGKNILGWTAARGLHVVATGPGGYDGLERLGDGRLVVSSQDGKGLFVITGTTMVAIAADLGQTGDIGIDPRRNRAAVPRLDNDTLEIRQLVNTPGK